MKSGIRLHVVAVICFSFAVLGYFVSSKMNAAEAVDDSQLLAITVQVLAPPQVIVPSRGGNRSPYLQLTLRAHEQDEFFGLVHGCEFLTNEEQKRALSALQVNDRLVVFVVPSAQGQSLRRIWKIQAAQQAMGREKNSEKSKEKELLDLASSRHAESMLADYKQSSANMVIFFYICLGTGLFGILFLRKLRALRKA